MSDMALKTATKRDLQFKSILLFNPFGIGDVLFSTPLVKALRQAYPKAVITYICNKRVRILLANNPNINNVIVYEKDDFRKMAKLSKVRFLKDVIGFIRRIKRLSIDLMVDLSLNYESALMSRILGVKKVIGFDFKKRGKFLTDKIKLEGFDTKHVALYYLDLLKILDKTYDDPYPEAFTCPTEDKCADNIIRENDLEGKYVIGMVPGSGRSWGENARYRRWPVSNFAHTADKIIESDGASVIIFGDYQEAKLCENMASLMRNPVLNLAGKTTLGQFMSIAKKCRFIFCNEGGPLHIAVALGVPTISIFGPVDEKVYGPFSKDIDKHIIVTERVKCKPCYSRFKMKKCDLIQCLNAITVDMVYGAIKEMMGRLDGGRTHAIAGK